MKNGLCPKCGGNDIRMGRHRTCHRDHLLLSIWGLGVEVINYVCISCGYLENYVREPDLATLAKKWSRVGPSGKAKPVSADPDGWDR